MRYLQICGRVVLVFLLEFLQFRREFLHLDAEKGLPAANGEHHPADDYRQDDDAQPVAEDVVKLIQKPVH